MNRLLLIMMFSILFFACNLQIDEPEEPTITEQTQEPVQPADPPPIVYISFDDVSQSYLDQYGLPEEISEYYSADYWSVDWWWWSQGFMVNFLNTTYDNISGWTVDHTYSFSPI
ncbi:MAG TPA: hypothetical protein ENH82_13155 [bacterium]|nr:hypothetical protein [bacterium]